MSDCMNSNISLALEHKLRNHISSEKEREYKHRDAVRHYPGDNYGHNTRPRRASPQEYLYSFDEKIEMPDAGRYGSMHKRKAVDQNMMLKGGLSPWVSLRNVSPELGEENEITEQSDQNGLVEKEEEQWNEEEEEGEQEEDVQGGIEEIEEEKEKNIESSGKENQEMEHDEGVEEMEEVEKVQSDHKDSSKKDKQIKWLQRKLSELLKGDKTSSVVQSHSTDRVHKYSKFRPVATEKLGYHAQKNYMRYDEADRKQSNTFGGTMKHDDINNYSFSLHNSE